MISNFANGMRRPMGAALPQQQQLPFPPQPAPPPQPQPAAPQQPPAQQPQPVRPMQGLRSNINAVAPGANAMVSLRRRLMNAHVALGGAP